MARSKEFDPDAAIDKALALFRQQGYEATSIDDLVKHLGIGRGSLYATFGSKHALYLAALDRYIEQIGGGQLPQTLGARDAIAALLQQQMEEALATARLGGCPLVNSIAERLPQDRAVAARVQANLGQAEELFFALLRNDATLGLSEAESRQTAQMLVNTVVGLRLTAKAHPDRERLLHIVTATLKVLG